MSRSMKPLYFVFAALALNAGRAHAQDIPAYAAELEKTLREFQSSDDLARKIMDGHLPRTNEGADKQVVIPSDQKDSKDYLYEKDRLRKELNSTLNGPGAGRSGIEAGDEVSDLVDNDNDVVNNVEDMDKKLRKAKLKTNPWSDTYWPIYMGTTAFRYSDVDSEATLGRMNKNDDWKVRFDFFNKLIEAPSLVPNVNALSPAEKYDLLVGDSSKTLTRLQWNLGSQYWTPRKGVETWMGLCHGWSPASFMLDRPTKSVQVTAADGKTKITFYPSDMKGLSTLLWANYQYQSRFIGGRCNTKDPSKTRAGRIKDQTCFDTNPGTWHMAIVNQIGVSKRSFVMDATYDIEVWNQPVLGYTYDYFNPVTGKATTSLSKALVSMADFKKSGKDKFAEFRKGKTKNIVGVSMEVSYMVEVEPTNSPTDSAANDAIEKVRYTYDLELDANNNIIGGEWYTNEHPDFLWVPAKKERAVSPADRFLRGDWKASKESFPSDWTSAAVRASQGQQPLGKVVEALINAANGKK